MTKEVEMKQKVVNYLTEFDSATRFGRCAGRTARLSLLHENKVSSHALQIISWHHVMYSLDYLHENIPILESKNIKNFGGLSLEDIENISEIHMESEFKEISGTFIEKFRHNLTKDELNLLTLDSSQPLYDLVNQIEDLGLQDIWQKLDSFYQWEKTGSQINDLIKSISGNDLSSTDQFESYKSPFGNLDSTKPSEAASIIANQLEGFVKDLKKYGARAEAAFDGDPEEIKRFVPQLDESFLKNGHYNLTSAVESEASNFITIFGNPGFGKTIQLRQFAHNFTERQFEKIEEIDSVILPVFVKAKVLAKNIEKIATVPYSIDMGDDEPFNGKSVSSSDELLQILIESAIESEPKISKSTLNEVLGEWDLSRVLVLIDAYDECQSVNDRTQILSVIADDLIESGMTVVATCRNSHQPELIENFSHLESGEIIQLDVSFTKHDLREVMPRKLANAWGVGGDDIAYQVEQKFKEYEEVLTHPLFVGLFCLLLDDGRLEQMDNITDTIHLNIPEGEMGLKHIKFLTQVIDIGLDINIKERNTEDVSDVKSNKLRTAFCHMAAANHIYNVTQIHLIFEFIEKGMNISLDTDEKKILTENLGIIYATDGMTIDWSHPTIPEVATGILLSQDGTYSKLFKSQDGHGIMKNFWSECLIMTMASYGVEINKPIDFYKSIHHILHRLDYHSTLKTLRMLGHIEKPIFTSLGFDDNTGQINPTFSGNLDPIHKDLGERYVEAANSSNAFPLPLHAFNLSKQIISVAARYQTEYKRAPIIHYKKASPVSIIDTETIDSMFENQNKAWATRKAVTTVKIYEKYYTKKEIDNFIDHVSNLISAKNYGRFELGNGSWLNIIDSIIGDPLFKNLYEALVDKIWNQEKFEFVVNTKSPSADFWIQRRGTKDDIGKPLRRYGSDGSSNFGITIPNGIQKESVFSFFRKKFKEGHWENNSNTFKEGRLNLLDIKNILASYEVENHNKMGITLDTESMMFVEDIFPNIYSNIKLLGQQITNTKSTGWSSYKLAVVVNRGIAKGLIWGLKNVYFRSGAKSQLGWIGSHFMFRQLLDDIIGSNEWNVEDIQKISFIEFVLDVLVGCDQEWILPEILSDINLARINAPNPWDLNR